MYSSFGKQKKKEGEPIRKYARHIGISAILMAAAVLIVIIIILWWFYGYYFVIYEPTETAIRAVNSTIGT
jgi:ammonia channel protein AmtB